MSFSCVLFGPRDIAVGRSGVAWSVLQAPHSWENCFMHGPLHTILSLQKFLYNQWLVACWGKFETPMKPQHDFLIYIYIYGLLSFNNRNEPPKVPYC